MTMQRLVHVRHRIRHFHRLAWLAVALAFGVIVFGAFVRLSNAGLSCPDWPTCYGRAAWPQHAHEVGRPRRHRDPRRRTAQGLARTAAPHARRLARRAGAGARAARRAPAPLRHRAGARAPRCWSASAFRCTCTGSTSPASVFAIAGEGVAAVRRAALVERRPRARRRAHAGGDRLPGVARHVDGDLAAQAHRGDGAPARRPAHVRAADVDGVARDRHADPPGRRARACACC